MGDRQAGQLFMTGDPVAEGVVQGEGGVVGGAGGHLDIPDQFGALLLFNVVAFGFVEIPLLCFLVAPDRTRATLAALQDWLRTRRRRAVTVLLTVVGSVLLVAGLAGL